MTADGAKVASAQAVECLRLHSVHKIGPVRFRYLMEHFGSVQAVKSASRSDLERVKTIGTTLSEAILEPQNDRFVEEELTRARKLGVRILCQADDEYPALLKEIPDAPVCLYVLGSLASKDRAGLAIVGSRRCSIYGLEQAYQFGMQVARTGMTVVSGLARGADAQAHLGALDCKGRTIAVLGCGIAHLRKHENFALAERIIQSGAVISELAIDRPPDAQNFPPRNRIIAGMTLGTLVIEAARRSGALITARLASEYNREVFSVPGRVDNDFAAGTLGLIQNSQAKLTTSLRDILEELGHAGETIRDNYEQTAAETLARVEPELSDDERTIFDVLSIEGVGLEHVCNSTRLPPERISSSLTLLQLKGVVEQLPGNRFARAGLK